jgi:hypothetical protein
VGLTTNLVPILSPPPILPTVLEILGKRLAGSREGDESVVVSESNVLVGAG